MVVFLVAWLFILLFLPYSFMRIWWIAKLDMIDSFPVLLCSSNAHRKLIPPPPNILMVVAVIAPP